MAMIQSSTVHYSIGHNIIAYNWPQWKYGPLSRKIDRAPHAKFKHVCNDDGCELTVNSWKVLSAF